MQKNGIGRSDPQKRGYGVGVSLIATTNMHSSCFELKAVVEIESGSRRSCRHGVISSSTSSGNYLPAYRVTTSIDDLNVEVFVYGIRLSSRFMPVSTPTFDVNGIALVMARLIIKGDRGIRPSSSAFATLASHTPVSSPLANPFVAVPLLDVSMARFQNVTLLPTSE